MKKTMLTLITVGFCFIVSFKIQTNEIIKNETFPMEYYRGHLYLLGKVNGIEGKYVFDTGAKNLYFDKIYYSNNNFEFKNTLKGILPGAGTKPQKVTVIMDTVEFKLGNSLYRTSKVPVLILKPILGDIADGIIGFEHFENSFLEINYENQEINKYSDIDAKNYSDWHKIKLVRKDNQFLIPLTVKVNDSINITGNYLLDFGSGSTISLTSLIGDKYNLGTNINKKIRYFTKYGGVGGESSSYVFYASSVNIGKYKFNKFIMDFSLDKSGALASKNYIGILGNEIYKRFNILLDFKNNFIYLKPNSNYNGLFKPSKLGFSYVDRSQTLNSWVVTGLYLSLNADKAGLKIDDKIISINGINIKDINYKSQESFFDEINEISLKVKRDGEFIKINFKLEPIITTANNGNRCTSPSKQKKG